MTIGAVTRGTFTVVNDPFHRGKLHLASVTDISWGKFQKDHWIRSAHDIYI